MVRLAILALLLFAPNVQAATTRYVATTGNDANPGTYAQPYRHIKYAVDAAQLGDTVLVRGGTYNERVDIVTAGITLSAYQSERAVIDGQNNLAAGATGGLVTLARNGITVSRFEVRNSNGRGIVSAANNNRISSNIVHNVQDAGIHNSNGSGGIFDGNEIYCAVMQNSIGGCVTDKKPICNPNIDGGWASAGNNYGVTANNQWLNNRIHDNCGEGIVAGTEVVIRGNEVYDNWSVDIYLDSGNSYLVEYNNAYETETEFISRDAGESSRKLAAGIGLQEETECGINPQIIIRNNRVYGTRYGLSFYGYYSPSQGCSGLRNVQILNNQFLESWEYGIRILGGAHSNTTIAGNLITSRRSVTGYDMIVENPSGIIFIHNVFDYPTKTFLPFWGLQ